MAIPPSGTFRYRLALRDSGPPWRLVAALEQPVKITGDRLEDGRLVGHAPAVDIWGDRITLVARQKRYASDAAAFIPVDPVVTAGLRPRDVLHVARTGAAGLGASIIRGGRLVLGVGAVRSVPLGEDVQAEVVWPEEPRATPGPFGNRGESAIAFTIGGQRHLLRSGVEARLGSYTVWIERGFIAGVPGTDECVLISLEDAFPKESALRWAQLLDRRDSLTGIAWESEVKRRDRYERRRSEDPGAGPRADDSGGERPPKTVHERKDGKKAWKFRNLLGF